MKRVLEANAPALLAIYGCGTVSAAALAVAGGGNPERLKSEAEFASLCGVAPLLASSGKTERHRLNRGGDRRANRALYQIAVPGCHMVGGPRITSGSASATENPRRRPSGASSATLPARCSGRCAARSKSKGRRGRICAPQDKPLALPWRKRGGPSTSDSKGQATLRPAPDERSVPGRIRCLANISGEKRELTCIGA